MIELPPMMAELLEQVDAWHSQHMLWKVCMALLKNRLEACKHLIVQAARLACNYILMQSLYIHLLRITALQVQASSARFEAYCRNSMRAKPALMSDLSSSYAELRAAQETCSLAAASISHLADAVEQVFLATAPSSGQATALLDCNIRTAAG